MTVASRKIISVEDSDTDFMALQFALQSAGVTIPLERCSSGQLAMASLISGDTCPLTDKTSLILLDLNLPGVDGLQLLKAFRARDPDRTVPVIILTTSSHPRDMAECYSAGADAYLVKPLELREWEKKVGALAEYWLARAQADPRNVGDTSAQDENNDSGARIAAHSASKAADIAQLTRTIESEVIPRLLLAHAAGGAKHRHSDSDIAPEHGKACSRVAELSRLVIQRDAHIAVAYIETMRANGEGLEVIFHELIAPAARHVGEMWKANHCDFTQFSRALDRLQEVLVALSPTRRHETMH